MGDKCESARRYAFRARTEVAASGGFGRFTANLVRGVNPPTVEARVASGYQVITIAHLYSHF